MGWRAALAAVVAGIALALAPRVTLAQRVLGPGEDAVAVPRGVTRVRVLAQWETFDERYGLGTRGRPAGALEPLTADLSLDSLGVAQLPWLAPVENELRSLTGLSDFAVTLGQTRLRSQARVLTVPIGLEHGITGRVALGLTVPVVQARHNVGLAVNPRGIEGNLGVNPALESPGVLGANAAALAQFELAARVLETNLASCTAAPTPPPSCAALLANAGAATRLVQESRQYAAGLARIYGTDAAGARYSPLVPVQGTDAQLAIQARVAAFSSLYGQFGVMVLPATAVPAAARGRLGVVDAQRVLTDSAFGIAASPLESVTSTHLGDVELAARVVLLDPFRGNNRARLDPRGLNVRVAATLGWRFGTGRVDSPEHLLDLPTGTGANGALARVAADVLVGRHLWATLSARYTNQLPDQQAMRITDAPAQVLAPLYRRQVVDRDLGDVLELEASPRWVLNDYFAVSGSYYYRRKGEDRFTGSFAIPDEATGIGALTLDASTLGQETEAREHRVGAGVTYSTVAAFERGRAPFALELSYLRQQTTRGSGGNVPNVGLDLLQARVYVRLLGK